MKNALDGAFINPDLRRFGMEVRLKNKPDGLFFNRQFCAEAQNCCDQAQNCCDRRGEITCVISPRGLSVERFGMEVKNEAL